MKVFLGLNGHTNNESLPLRFGIKIKEHHQQFCILQNAIKDQEGTKRQRQDEIERGNEHYSGELLIPGLDKNNAPAPFKCRVVLGVPKLDHQSPPIITLLRDGSRGDMTVTKHISGMVKRGKITSDDIIHLLHPAYIADKIKDSNDVEEIVASSIINKPEAPVLTISKADELILSSADEIKATIDSFPIEGIELEAGPNFKRLSLKERVKYQYSMADAYVEDAWTANDKIWVRVIGSNGEKTDLHSFKQRDHLAVHHQKTLEYLQSRIGQRAHFAVCMSDPCKGFLAESVTSIALQLMKS
jgi:hypothetical protein